MKKMILLFLLMTSTQAFSAVVTEDLEGDDVSLAIQLADNHAVPLKGSVCNSQEFLVVSQVISFNPAEWTLSSGDQVSSLSHDEIKGAIKLVHSKSIPLIRVNPITTKTQFKIRGATCGFNPTSWTISFEK